MVENNSWFFPPLWSELENKPCDSSSFIACNLFNEAIREHDSIFKLEYIRKQDFYCFTRDPMNRKLRPGYTISCAIATNHVPYARYLLTEYADDYMKVAESECEPYSHFTFDMFRAILQNFREILKMIMEFLRDRNLLQYCINLPEEMMKRRTTLHLACEHLRPDFILMLLYHGATSKPDDTEQTPLDILIKHLWISRDNMKLKFQCIYLFLIYELPRVLFMQKNLEDNKEYWESLLGEDIYTYLLGKRPAPLGLMSMKKILQQLPPKNFLESIERLPIPKKMKDMVAPDPTSTPETNNINNHPYFQYYPSTETDWYKKPTTTNREPL